MDLTAYQGQCTECGELKRVYYRLANNKTRDAMRYGNFMETNGNCPSCMVKYNGKGSMKWLHEVPYYEVKKDLDKMVGESWVDWDFAAEMASNEQKLDVIANGNEKRSAEIIDWINKKI